MVIRLRWIAEVSLRRVLEMCTVLIVQGRRDGREPEGKSNRFLV